MRNSGGNGTVLWELDARGVAAVALNRPEVNNAYNGDLVAGVHASRMRNLRNWCASMRMRVSLPRRLKAWRHSGKSASRSGIRLPHDRIQRT